MRFHYSFSSLIFIGLLSYGLITWLSCSSPTGGGADVTPPAVPTGIGFENNTISNGAASLFWTPVRAKDLAGYQVWWSEGTEIDTTTAMRKFVVPSATVIHGLEYGTRYVFAVSAIDRSGNESPLSLPLSGIPANTTSPLPPSNVSILGQNADTPQIMIYWQKNKEYDVDHYNIYRSIMNLPAPEKKIATVETEFFTDTIVDVNTYYSYTVTAVDKEGWESGHSSVVSDLSLPKAVLDGPGTFAFVPVKPTFTWEPVDNAVSYYIVVTDSQIGGEIWKKIVPAKTTRITYNGPKLALGNTYYWRVGAISQSEVNSTSEIRPFVVQPPVVLGQ